MTEKKVLVHLIQCIKGLQIIFSVTNLIFLLNTDCKPWYSVIVLRFCKHLNQPKENNLGYKVSRRIKLVFMRINAILD